MVPLAPGVIDARQGRNPVLASATRAWLAFTMLERVCCLLSGRYPGRTVGIRGQGPCPDGIVLGCPDEPKLTQTERHKFQIEQPAIAIADIQEIRNRQVRTKLVTSADAPAVIYEVPASVKDGVPRRDTATLRDETAPLFDADQAGCDKISIRVVQHDSPFRLTCSNVAPLLHTNPTEGAAGMVAGITRPPTCKKGYRCGRGTS